MVAEVMYDILEGLLQEKANEFCKREIPKLPETLSKGQVEMLLYKAYKTGAIEWSKDCRENYELKIQSLENQIQEMKDEIDDAKIEKDFAEE